MNSIRSIRSAYVAAFLLGVLVALIAALPARAAGPVQTAAPDVPGSQILVGIRSVPDEAVILYSAPQGPASDVLIRGIGPIHLSPEGAQDDSPGRSPNLST